MRLCVLRARASGVSAVVCMGAPLRARVTHEMTHLDGRAVRVRPRELRALSSRCCRCEHLLRAKESHDAFGRVGSTHVERFYGCGPRRATPGPYAVLEMVHLDGRVGWCARELRALSEVLLQASFVCKGIP
jgi:hypothetical protein